ncbi:MAG: amidase [bacterium]
MADVHTTRRDAQSNSFRAWIEVLRRGPDHAADTIAGALDAVSPSTKGTCIAHLVDTEALRSAFRNAGTLELSGIPYMLKDLFDVAGLPTRAGGTFLPEVRGNASRDCRMKGALDRLGAVFVGKTHLNEFAYGLDGVNAHYGNVPHPWDGDRISGGSSSGSAWAVGRGIVPLAFGTDTGGSVRVPAALCGIYGVRLEPNALVREGVFPLSRTFDTVGWFTGLPEDAATFWEALASVDADVDLSPDTWTGRTIYSPREDVVGDPHMRRLYEDAVTLLSGATPAAEAEAKKLDHYLRASSRDHVTAYNVIGSSDAYDVHEPYLRHFGGRYEERVRLLIERGAHWPQEVRDRAREVQRRTEEHLRSLLSEYDAVVSPTTHVVAPPVAEAGVDFRSRILALTAPASLARVPVVTVPVFRDDGLSGGLQVLIHPERPGIGISLLRHLAAHRA